MTETSGVSVKSFLTSSKFIVSLRFDITVSPGGPHTKENTHAEAWRYIDQYTGFMVYAACGLMYCIAD
ncbi:hypothetical protein PAJ34TS1_44020 [Paenibacillus azoreducens]